MNGAALGFIALLAAPGLAADGDSGPLYDLEKVSGAEYFPQDPALRALLARNGFAVVPRFYRQIFGPYLDAWPLGFQVPLPPLVTAESALRTYQVILEEGLRHLELAQAGRLLAISRRLTSDLKALEPDAPPRARRTVLAWAAVGLALQAGVGELEALPPEPAALAREELARIEKGELAPSAIFDREFAFPFELLRPSEMYAGDQGLAAFYRAVRWYGLTSFRAGSEGESSSALLLALAARRDPALIEGIATFAGAYDEVLGKPEDVGPAEAAAVLGKLLPDPRAPLSAKELLGVLPAFREALSALSGANSNDGVLDLEGFRNFSCATKGVRLLPPRPSWAGELFGKVAAKAAPVKALQAMRALGDERAEVLLRREEGEAAEGGLRIAREEGPRIWASAPPCLYRDSVAVLEELFRPAPPGAPAFARSEAWRSMCSWAALGSWACLRHAWELHERELIVVYGDPIRRSGYVVPYPGFFERLAEVVRRTDDFLERRGAYGPVVEALRPPLSPGAGEEEEEERSLGASPEAVRGNLRDLAKLLDVLAGISRKQIESRPLEEAERNLLEGYGKTIGRLQFFPDPLVPDDNMPLVSRLATDATVPGSPREIYLAIGRAIALYAVRDAPAEDVVDPWTQRTVRIPAGPQLYRGGTFSVYEFDRTAAIPFGDAEWRQVLAGPQPPSFPAWASEFLLPIRATVAERLAAGEAVAVDAEDPDPALKEAALRGYDLARRKGDRRAGQDHLEIFLKRVGPGDAQTLIDLAARIDVPEHLYAVATNFEADAPTEKALLARAASAPPNVLALAMMVVDEKLPVDELKKILGDSEFGRWAFGQVLEARIGAGLNEENRALIASAIEALRGLAGDPSPLVRARAMVSLRDRPDPAARAILEKGLADPSPAVRAAAAWAHPMDDTASVALIVRALWYADDPAVRERGLAEAEALDRWLALDPLGWRVRAGRDAAPLVQWLVDRLDCGTSPAWLASLAAAKVLEDPLSGEWVYRLLTGSPKLHAEVIAKIAADPRRPAEVRRAVLEGLSFDEKKDADLAKALGPLLDDRTALGDDGVRAADLAAAAIVRVLGLETSRLSPAAAADRDSAIQRARAIVDSLAE